MQHTDIVCIEYLTNTTMIGRVIRFSTLIDLLHSTMHVRLTSLSVGTLHSIQKSGSVSQELKLWVLAVRLSQQ